MRGKRCFRSHQQAVGLETKYTMAVEQMSRAMSTDEAAEGTRSMLNKRPAAYAR